MKLQNLIKEINVAKKIKADKLKQIASDVIENYKNDKRSRERWEKRAEEAIKLSKQMLDKKSHPWEGAANVCIPILTTASQGFASRVYPEIISGTDLVKIGVFGDDPDGRKFARAQRVTKHMTYQLLVESDTWESETDSLLHILPLIGTCFRKVYYSVLEQRTCSDLCNPQDIIVNHNEKSLESAERITHRYLVNRREAVERVRAGLYLDFDTEAHLEPETRWNITEDKEDMYPQQKMSKIEILEQHCFLDLDEDGYEEPWIVIVAKSTAEVIAIYPRFDPSGVKYLPDGTILSIEPLLYFIDYHFIPSPDGGFYSLGYGHILHTMLNAANTLDNQLIDAGTLANTNCGFYTKDLKIKGGQLKVKQGEFKEVDATLTGGRIQDKIYTFQFQPPNPVTLQLLQAHIDMMKEITSITDMSSGNQKAQNAPAQSVVEIANQSMKNYSSIAKRFYRSLKKEFKLIYRFNALYLDDEQYYKYNDNPQFIRRQDYALDDMDVAPVADPALSADTQKQLQANVLIMLMQNPAVLQEIKVPAVMQLVGEGLKIPPDQLQSLFFTPEEKAQMSQQQPPDPQVMKAQANMQKVQLDAQKAKADYEIKAQQNQNAEFANKIKLMDTMHRFQIKDAETDERQAKMLGDAHVKDADALLKAAQARSLDESLQLEREKNAIALAKVNVEREKLNNDNKPTGP
jgi:chaperonin GroES